MPEARQEAGDTGRPGRAVAASTGTSAQNLTASPRGARGTAFGLAGTVTVRLPGGQGTAWRALPARWLEAVAVSRVPHRLAR
jgi:hypothetical protein